MLELIFATNNSNKLKEIQNIIKNGINLIGLNALNFYGDIPEEQDTLEGNASQKAFYIYEKFKINCFADDTGIEIDALNGKPGVFSARFAKNDPDYSFIPDINEANIQKVLNLMNDKKNRNARFRTVISLIEEGKEKQFEGIIKGKIAFQKSGTKGFGYDPIFVPNGYNISFAQMSMDEKNKISHRAIAFNKLAYYINNHA
jgi:XTP/dITP diphosphohydrolase